MDTHPVSDPMPVTALDGDEYATLEEVAMALGVVANTVRAYVSTGRIPAPCVIDGKKHWQRAEVENAIGKPVPRLAPPRPTNATPYIDSPHRGYGLAGDELDEVIADALAVLARRRAG